MQGAFTNIYTEVNVTLDTKPSAVVLLHTGRVWKPHYFTLEAAEHMKLHGGDARC